MTQNQSLSVLGQIAPANTGTAGQVLTSNGSSNSYWSTVAAGTNVAAQYAWTNTQSFSAVVTHTANVSVNGAIIANGGAGTSGQVLTSSAGGNVYWSTTAGGGSFSNGASISVANLAITGSVTANGSVGTSGQALVSTGTGVQWGALSPGYNYSSQFNGSSTFLTTPTSATFNLNAVDWTIECWFYATATPPANITNIIQSYQGTNNWQPYVGIGLNTNLTFQIVINAVGAATTQTFTLNSWNHIALVRSGGVVKFYLNGVATSISTTSDITSSNLNWFIGKVDNAQGGGGYLYYYTGYLSNVRIIKGTAVYTAAFTPPTSPLSAITNTSLLTCNAITPTSDSSTNNHALTNNGPVTTTATLSPFTSTTVSIPTASLTAVRQQFTGDGSTTSFAVAGGYTPNAISVFVNGVLLRNGTEVTVTNGSTVVFAIAPLSGALIDVIGTVPTTYSSITPVSYSVGFNGSSQYLSAACSSATNVGTGNFTMELWFNLTNTTNTGALGPGLVATQAQDSTFSTIYMNGTTPNLWLNNGASLTSSTAIVLSTWNHIAIVRSGTTLSMYLNGVSVASTTNSSAINWGNLYLGVQKPATGGWIAGYISNFRFINGLAVYTNNFTVPSSPLAITQSASGAYIQAITGTQTSLLTCNGPTIVDGSTNAFTITNNGSAPVSTAIVPTFTNVTINNAGSTFFYNIQYLIVAGGGGGGGGGADFDSAGGGGAGGFLIGAAVLNFNTVYTITVGSGGAGGTNTGTVGTQGGNSLISGIATSIGGGYGAKAAIAGGSGGSGGGAGSSGYSPGTGATGQGYAGGTGNSWGGGGGGGATAVGGNGSGASGTGVGGNGGAGGISYITGSAVTYAGGGGGGTDRGGTVGTGGSGGGGNAGTSNGGNGTAGTVNTGGGGGAGSFSTTTGYAGGAGGSGVVILSVPTTNYSGITTGTPTVTTSGGFTILKFTASGTYTA